MKTIADKSVNSSALGGLRFAHISDLHLSDIQHWELRDLLNKRMLGYVSWRRRRRNLHCNGILEALVRDLHNYEPEHIVITGDLTQTGLPVEFIQVRKWLSKLGTTRQVTIVPGNHDAYAHTPWEQSFKHWIDYMDSDVPADDSQTFFPSVRVRGPVAFIGLSSAVPTAPFFATGQIGKIQLKRLRSILNETASLGLFRVVLLHHAPLPGLDTWRKRLIDAKHFSNVLINSGVNLVLHGHNHRAVYSALKTRLGIAPIISVSSGSAVSTSETRRACYHLFHVIRGLTGWQLTINTRSYSHTKQQFHHEFMRQIAL